MRTSTLPAVDPWRSPAAYAVFARADTVRSESLAGTRLRQLSRMCPRIINSECVLDPEELAGGGLHPRRRAEPLRVVRSSALNDE